MRGSLIPVLLKLNYTVLALEPPHRAEFEGVSQQAIVTWNEWIVEQKPGGWVRVRLNWETHFLPGHSVLKTLHVFLRPLMYANHVSTAHLYRKKVEGRFPLDGRCSPIPITRQLYGIVER